LQFGLFIEKIATALSNKNLLTETSLEICEKPMAFMFFIDPREAKRIPLVIRFDNNYESFNIKILEFSCAWNNSIILYEKPVSTTLLDKEESMESLIHDLVNISLNSFISTTTKGDVVVLEIRKVIF
jgi:hypothetical protein